MAADQNTQFEKDRKPKRRDTFLATMKALVPRTALCNAIEPYHPRACNGHA